MKEEKENFKKTVAEDKANKRDKKIKEAEQITEEQYELLKSELDKKDNQIIEYVETLQRLKAEFENFRKRMLKEQTNYVQMAGEDLILKLLPVLDNFERAIIMTGDTEEHKGIIKGLEMVYSEFIAVLEKEGLSVIPTEGQFNPELHEAVMQVEEEGYEENAVVDVLRKGYVLKNKLIRPAMVKVAKHGL